MPPCMQLTMLQFVTFTAFIISISGQSDPDQAINTCDPTSTLDCVSYGENYDNSEVCCTGTTSIEKYANTCYYDCNGDRASGSGYQYHSQAGYMCGACCDTDPAMNLPCTVIDPIMNDTARCYSPFEFADPIVSTEGFCQIYPNGPNNPCPGQFTCDVTASSPCGFLGAAYECLPNQYYPQCTECVHPCVTAYGNQAPCLYSDENAMCYEKTTDPDTGYLVGTGRVGTCLYTDLTDTVQCLTCEVITLNPTANPTTPEPTPNPTVARPTMAPITSQPTQQTAVPTGVPTTANPTTANPTTANPTTANPSANPSANPTGVPTTAAPIAAPSADPTTDLPTDPPTDPPTEPSDSTLTPYGGDSKAYRYDIGVSVLVATVCYVMA